MQSWKSGSSPKPAATRGAAKTSPDAVVGLGITCALLTSKLLGTRDVNPKEESWVKLVAVPTPSLKNNTADADRLVEALKDRLQTRRLVLAMDLDLLRQIPFRLREGSDRFLCTLFKDRERWTLVGLQAEAKQTPPAGLAIDLGTSRVVLRLIDLASHEILGESASDNPQIGIGADILTRIHYAERKGGLQHLQQLICDGINRQVESVCLSCRRKPTDIYLAAVAGNTAMTQLLLGLSPHWLIREPYIPVVNRPGLISAADIGIQLNPLARVFVFPNIGSYFGGDLISGILYAELHKAEETAILVDVGTNAEVVLGNSQWLIACAGAAGPALEGGVTRMGMMAGPGVIDRVTYDSNAGRLDCHTIADDKPRGICGSGLIDLAAQLFLVGMIDIRGRFLPDACGDRLIAVDGVPHLVIVPARESATGSALTISQADLDSLIRSKAAMYTILETITAAVGLRPENISTFYVAGTFGTLIQPFSAISIGMMPDLPLQAYRPLGNSSLGGATLVLSSDRRLDEVDQIRDRITYLELNVNQDFMNRFSAAKFLPHTDESRFPSVKRQKRAGPTKMVDQGSSRNR